MAPAHGCQLCTRKRQLLLEAGNETDLRRAAPLRVDVAMDIPKAGHG